MMHDVCARQQPIAWHSGCTVLTCVPTVCAVSPFPLAPPTHKYPLLLRRRHTFSTQTAPATRPVFCGSTSSTSSLSSCSSTTSATKRTKRRRTRKRTSCLYTYFFHGCAQHSICVLASLTGPFALWNHFLLCEKCPRCTEGPCVFTSILREAEPSSSASSWHTPEWGRGEVICGRSGRGSCLSATGRGRTSGNLESRPCADAHTD